MDAYTCSCTDGFHGNGSECFDTDECRDGSHQCNDHAVCCNTVESYSCACKTGYEGNGWDCTGKQSIINTGMVILLAFYIIA